MSNIVDPLVGQIASRIRAERENRRWTLAQLADASGVSPAMISRIERGESSPTAVLLGRLSAAFQLSIAALLDDAGTGPATGVRRGTEAAEWRDPGTGYRRRQITGPGFPAEIAEIHLPAGARVPYPAAAFAFIRQIVWVLDGRLTFHDGDAVHELGPGDTIELGEPAERAFVNATGSDCRYVVILTRHTQP
ncbi:XRE family transcriptional regulator [Actinoplanes sp. NPDC049802]|uniref:helix-turn-helix domain-containing protein n=1 Tax=Actinoplanes sp. NPDC049802 TaxID=3154742 RepID=UPI0033D89A49